MTDFDAVVGLELAEEMRQADERALHDDCDAILRLRERLGLTTLAIPAFEAALMRFPPSSERREALELVHRLAARASDVA